MLEIDSDQRTFLYRHFLTDFPDMYIKYNFTGEPISLNDKLKKLMSNSNVCFGDYGYRWSDYILSEKYNRTLPKYSISLFMNPTHIEPLLNYLTKSFTNFSFQITGRKECLLYKPNTLTMSIFGKYDKDIVKNDATFLDSVIKTITAIENDSKNPGIELVSFIIESNDKYSLASLYNLYYLLGVVIRTFSASERRELVNNSETVEKIIRNAFYCLRHHSICEIDLPMEVLYKMNNIEEVNRVFKYSEVEAENRKVKYYIKPRQTQICTKLSEINEEKENG